MKSQFSVNHELPQMSCGCRKRAWSPVFSGLSCLLLFIIFVNVPGPFAQSASLEVKRIAIMRGPGADGKTYPDVEKAVFAAEVASDSESIVKGLSGRDAMTDDQAMLFMLKDRGIVYFWMKGMRFPLDIVTFDRDRRILAINNNLQPCESCQIIMMPSEAAYVLEIKAGLSEKYGLRNGDFFEIR